MARKGRWWEDKVKMRRHRLGRYKLPRQRTESAEFFLFSLCALSTRPWLEVFSVESDLSPLAWMCAYPAATGLGYSSTGLAHTHVDACKHTAATGLVSWLSIHSVQSTFLDIQLTFMEISGFFCIFFSSPLQPACYTFCHHPSPNRRRSH